MKTKLFILFSILTLVFACTSRRDFNKESRVEKSMSADMEMMDQSIPPTPPPSSNATNADKKIIKTAYLSIEVFDYAKSRKLIDSTISSFGAYIVSENLQNTESQISNSINIKVPENQFEELLVRLSKIAKNVDFQNIETQDVTEEYIDVESRLNNSRKVEQTYLKLLRRTTSIEDILRIEQKLGEIRTEIESTQGRLKYLNQKVSYSSINLSVYQAKAFKYVPNKLPNFLQQLKKSLDAGWRGIVMFILFLTKLWPLWVIGTAGWFGWKYFIRLRKFLKKDRKRRKKMLKREEQDNTNQA